MSPANDRLPEWVAEHWVQAGFLMGAKGGLLAAAVTWNPIVGVIVGVLFGSFVTWAWRPGGPAHKWRAALVRRYPPKSD